MRLEATVNTWTMIASIVGAVGGLVGLVFGALGIWYARAGHVRAAAEHDIVLRRFQREEAAREVADRKDALLRKAHEAAQAAGSSSTMSETTFKLESELDRQAALELVREGLATVNGDQCSIPINKLPDELRR